MAEMSVHATGLQEHRRALILAGSGTICGRKDGAARAASTAASISRHYKSAASRAPVVVGLG
jgi:hypothetical protein